MSEDIYEINADRHVIEKIVALGGHVNTAGKITNEGDPFAIVADGFHVENLSHLVPPPRIARNVHLMEVESFCAYVNRFKQSDSLIFCDMGAEGCTFTAMLDYHGAAPDLTPRHCQHMARYTAMFTPEWQVLREASGESFNQVAFATFLEDNQKLFVSPSGADLLELVKSLHGHRNARFNTALRLDNGAYSVSFDEDIVIKGSNVSKAGDMTLPDKLTCAAKVFLGGDKWEINARLKTACKDRQLVIWYQIIGVPEIIRENIFSLVKKINEKTEILPMLGRP
jgi:uncharacterized protein YfdQ (DUF2303 family)